MPTQNCGIAKHLGTRAQYRIHANKNISEYLMWLFDKSVILLGLDTVLLHYTLHSCYTQYFLSISSASQVWRCAAAPAVVADMFCLVYLLLSTRSCGCQTVHYTDNVCVCWRQDLFTCCSTVGYIIDTSRGIWRYVCLSKHLLQFRCLYGSKTKMLSFNIMYIGLRLNNNAPLVFFLG